MATTSNNVHQIVLISGLILHHQLLMQNLNRSNLVRQTNSTSVGTKKFVFWILMMES